MAGIAAEFTASDSIPAYMASAYIRAPGVPCSSWSWGNRLMTALVGRTDDARGYRQWEKVGRHVKRGAKAFPILAPMTVRREPKNEGEEATTAVIGFRAVPVFRVQDTEGDPLPEYVPATIPPLASLAKIRYRNTTHGEEGSYNTRTGDITLCTEDPAVYLHELMHRYDFKTHEPRDGQDPEQEIVAELGACVLARMYDVERSAENHMAYIATYAKAKTPAEVGAACLRMADRVMQAIQMILADAAKLA